MKTNKIIVIQLILAVFFLSGYYLYTKSNSEQSKYSEKTSYSWLVNLENTYENEDLPEKFFELINKDKTELIDTSNKLVFRFSQIYCGTCVTREIRLLKEFAKEIGWENIIFIATNSDEEYLLRFKRASQIKTKIFNVPISYFRLDDESIDTPYMFIVDSDFIFKELFISMRENEERTRIHLKKIKPFF